MARFEHSYTAQHNIARSQKRAKRVSYTGKMVDPDGPVWVVSANIDGEWQWAAYNAQEEAEKVSDALEQDYCLPTADVKITVSRNVSRTTLGLSRRMRDR